MTLFQRICRALALPMAVVVLITSLPVDVASAAMMSTDQVIAEEVSAADRERVLEFLAREDVREEIVALGIDPEEASRRVQSLSDAEIQQIVGAMDQEPAGQSVIAALVITILVIFLILIITDLLGVTDVFPFINKAR